MKNVIPILAYQDKCICDVYCVDCSWEGDILFPETMDVDRVPCAGCGKCGFLVDNHANK